MAGSDGAERTVSLEEALGHAAAMLRHDPRLALAQAGAILEAVPGHPQAVLIQGQALHHLGDLPAARTVLGRLAAQHITRRN